MKSVLHKIAIQLSANIGAWLNAVKRERRKLVLLMIFVIGVVVLLAQTILAFWHLKNNF